MSTSNPEFGVRMGVGGALPCPHRIREGSLNGSCRAVTCPHHILGVRMGFGGLYRVRIVSGNCISLIGS